MATGSGDNRLRIVDAATGAVEKEVLHEDEVDSVAWSPLGTKVATGSEGQRLRIVDAATGAVEKEVLHEYRVRYSPYVAAPYVVAWSP